MLLRANSSQLQLALPCDKRQRSRLLGDCHAPETRGIQSGSMPQRLKSSARAMSARAARNAELSHKFCERP